MIANAGTNSSTLKIQGGWKSSSVAQSCVESSLYSRDTIAKMISNHIPCESEPPVKKYCTVTKLSKITTFRYKKSTTMLITEACTVTKTC